MEETALCINREWKNLAMSRPVRACTTGTALLCANILTPILAGLRESLLVAGVVLFIIMALLFRA